jgi:TetR/AcrR family transcriptional regulator, transcriptional repressor for nem operon
MNVHIGRVPRPSKKHQLIDRGMETVRRHGLVGSSIRDVTTGAEVPLGSFSNHFPSKEAFGVAVIDRYFADVRVVIADTLDDTSRPPLARLRAYFDAITERLASRGWHDGCLIGNTSLDSTEGSEAIRTRLREVFTEWHQPFARCLAAAEADGEIVLPLPPPDLADFLMASWQGAMLRMKVERSAAPLERFKTVVFGRLLAPAT